MKKCACFLLFFIAMPLCAQKNLLPAAKAVLGKQTAEAALTPQAARNIERSVWQTKKGKFHSRLPEISRTVLSASGTHQPRRAAGKENTILLGGKLASLQRFYLQGAPLNLKATEMRALQDFIRTLQEIQQLKTQYTVFNYDYSFDRKFLHLYQFSPFAIQNNRLVLKTLKNYIRKMEWFNRYPNKGRQQLAKETGKNVIAQLAWRLKDEKMIMLGEYHFIQEFQQAVSELLLALKTQNPGRRIVLFTEFLKMPGGKKLTGRTLETYYQRGKEAPLPQITKQDLRSQTYARAAFLSLIKERIEIYPLEDIEHFNLLTEISTKAIDSPLASVSRNKSWARTIEAKMAQIRQTDPDALFVVYGGMGHTSWLSPAALPKFFAKEKPVVVEFSLSNTLYGTTLSNGWSQKEDFFVNPPTEKSFFYWTGENAELFSKNTGFDYLLVIPENSAAREERNREFIVEMP